MRKVNILCILLNTAAVVIGVRNGYDCRRSTQGTDYLGRINTTVNGRTCQRWDSQVPHSHPYTDGRFYPDMSLSHAENSCRDPHNSHGTNLWCYTTDPAVRWEDCDVPKCAGYPECKQTDSGVEYSGHLAETSSGQPCAAWGQDFPELRFNYCRNPDSKVDGPWCYTDPEHTQWGFCDVNLCKPSASCLTSPSGANYAGTTSMTVSSVPCQRWDYDVPHSTNYSDASAFPDDSLMDAENFCRNPEGEKQAPWCYTIDPDTEWDYCAIPACRDCKVTAEGREYAGTLSVTSSGRTCQAWASQTPHAHNMTDPNRYPDASLDDAQNFCRNPNKDPAGPWCYTDDPGEINKEYCDIPYCEDANEKPIQAIRHVLHIGADGVDTCFLGANISNILNRLAAEGSYTFDQARSVIPSMSMPSWTTALCGSGPESTGVDDNYWLPVWLGFDWPLTPVSGKNSPIPCLFDILQRTDANVHTGMFYTWPNLESLASSGSPGRLDKDQYCESEVFGGYDKCDEQTVNNVTAYMNKLTQTTESSYTFVYLSYVDQSGHDFGWCSPTYLNAVSTMDEQVGRILDAIQATGLEDEFLVVLNTDHGGLDFSHGVNRDDDFRIPIFFKGPGIKKNYEIKYEVLNADIVPTIAHLMGFNPSPWWSGRIVQEILL